MSEEATKEGPVTVVVSRIVKPGREADYEQWIRDSVQAMRQFPGFLGAAVEKPSKLNPHWVFMPRWESPERLLAWDNSPELQARVEVLMPLIEGGTKLQHHQGLDFWFIPPEGAVKKAPAWKMLLVTIMVLWPTILLLNWVMSFMPFLAKVPWLFGPLPMLLIMMPLMEFILMPIVTRLLRGWLFGAK